MIDKERLIKLVRGVEAGEPSAVTALKDAGILSFNTIPDAGTFPAYALPGADLGGADLSALRLVLSDFKGAVLAGANLTNSVLVGTSFVDADLSAAMLQASMPVDADFSGASLAGADLCFANLANALFSEADCAGTHWHEAILVDCNFKGALDLDVLALADASRLRGVTLPDGSRYDGRFSLSGDIEDMAAFGVSLNKLEEMADFYGVSKLQFLAGQGWALKEWPRLREKRARNEGG